MPFALVFVGLLLIVTGAKDTYQQFGRQVAGDFTGDNNFTYWLAAMGAVGSLGYIEALKPFSRAFLALILVGMVLRNGGFFDKFTAALATGPIAPTKRADPLTATPNVDAFHSLLNQGAGFTDTSDLGAHAGAEAHDVATDVITHPMDNYSNPLNWVQQFLRFLNPVSPAY